MGNPTVTPIAETLKSGNFVIWEPSDGMVSRDAITLKSGLGIVTAGLVLGALLTGTAASAALGTNTGNGVMGAITVGSAAMPGDYKLTIIEAAANAGAFVVEDPLGNEIGHGNVAAAFNAGGLAFTLADGATDFVAGDSFKITVTATAIKYVAFDPTATDGSQNAAAILWSGYRDATSADKKAVAIVRGPCRINSGELLWGANVTTAGQKTAALAQLAALGIQSTPST